MEEKNTDSLWKIINRIDSYVISTNNKATLLLAFNTFLVSGIILKWSDIIEMYIYSPIIKVIVSFLLIICTCASIFSLLRLFQVINPYLYSYIFPEKYHSKLFFLHIADYQTESDYYNAVLELSNVNLIKDLTFQIFSLSKGISRKFYLLKQAICAILYVILPALVLLIMFKVYLILSQITILTGA